MVSSPEPGRGIQWPEKPKTYTPKFKFQLVSEVLRGERSEVEIGRIYGVHHTTISKWKRQFLENGAEVFGGNEEVERYEKKIALSWSACSARKSSSSPC